LPEGGEEKDEELETVGLEEDDDEWVGRKITVTVRFCA
jgi:hypothetical protein